MLQKLPDRSRFAQPQAEQTAFLRPESSVCLSLRKETAPKPAGTANGSTTQASSIFRVAASGGFSLVELLVALTLFAIVSLGVYPLMWTNMQTNTRNGLHRAAESVAVRWMDSLLAQGYNGLATVAEKSDPLDNNFRYQVLVTTNAANDRKDILLTIRWSLGKNDYNYSVQTVKVRNS